MSYFDTSVIVAYYVPEKLSTYAQQRLSTAAHAVVSELTQIEFVSALSLRHRIGDLTYAEVQRVSSLFAGHLDTGLYQKLHFDSAVFQTAYSYLSRFDLPLKAPDALHLAAAWQLQSTLITADHQLARNAKALDIPAELIEV